MKKIILSLLGIVILFVCCDKDNNIVDTLEVIDQKITPSYQSVSVQCLLSTRATISESYVQLSTTSDFSKYDSKVMKKDSNGWYVAEVQGLKENTEYYFRYQAENNYSSFLSQYGDQFSFITKSYLLATVVTTSATNVTYTSASVGGEVRSDGGTTVTERGVVYSTSSKPTTSNSKKRSGSGTGAYSVELSDLSEGTTYYVRAYAINSKGTAYGEQVSFTTKGYSLPTVVTTSVTNVTYTSASVGGEVTNDGNTTVTERGVVYSTSSNPTISNSKKRSGSGTGAYSVELSDLSEGTTYYVRAYAINSKGTAYGEQVSFTTLRSNGGNTGNTKKTIVFDADVDQGNAGTDYNYPSSYTITKDGVTITVSEGIIGTYNNVDHYRVYKYQTLTVSTTSGSIKSVEFTCTANGDEKYGPGGFTWSIGKYSYSGAVGTWTGNASEVVFTASSNQVRATEIKVVVESSESSTAKVRFQKMDDYYITDMYLYDAEDNVLAEYWFGDPAGISSYFEIPSGNAYPVMYDSWDDKLYYMLDDPHYYYFESGCKYTVQLTDDGSYYVSNVIKDGTFNLPAKVVATYKVHKNELRIRKK